MISAGRLTYLFLYFQSTLSSKGKTQTYIIELHTDIFETQVQVLDELSLAMIDPSLSLLDIFTADLAWLVFNTCLGKSKRSIHFKINL